MVVNIIYCGAPHSKAIVEECEDVDTHNIHIRKNLPPDRMREKIKHELLHIINDDFSVDRHVNLVENMVRHQELSEDDMEQINFYYHVL